MAGHEITVITFAQGDAVAACGGSSPRVWRLVGPPRRGPGFMQRLASAIRVVDPDVMHVHMSLVSPLALTAAVLGARHAIATVVTMHSMCGDIARGVYGLSDRCVRWSNWPLLWTTVSSASAASLAPLLSAGRPMVIPNAIDVARWSSPANTSQATEARRDLHVVSVGRLSARKDPMELLRVLRGARVRLPETVRLRASVVGDGPQRRPMERFITRHAMQEWVHLLGSRSSDSVHRLLGQGDLFVAPAAMESFGIAALEARCAGLPILARANTGVVDFVRHEREGLLARGREELIEGLVRMAADPALRTMIGRYNRSNVPWQFGWNAVLAQVQAAYSLAQVRFGATRLILASPMPVDATATPSPPQPRWGFPRRG
jgi:glycosyltransferase involved in cell wall biosynthesis